MASVTNGRISDKSHDYQCVGVRWCQRSVKTASSGPNGPVSKCLAGESNCSVAGQLLFKRAMSEQVNTPRARRFFDLAAGILAMTVGFCTWLAVLHRFDLSFLYPFVGLERVLLALAAWLFLRERITKDLWIGVSLICLGNAFVAAS